MCAGFVPCAMAEETVTASSDAASEAEDTKILRCIKNMKKISGKVNTKAEVFVLIIRYYHSLDVITVVKSICLNSY